MERKVSRHNPDYVKYFLTFFLALVLRLFYLNQVSQSPLFNHPMMDEFEYDVWATQIASGKLLWNTVLVHGPLYPYLLAIIYKVFGHSYYIARLSGGILSSFICVLLAYAGSVSFGRKIGFIAGFLAAIYWPFIYWSGELVSDTLALFLNLTAFLFLLKAMETKRVLPFLFSGALIGLSSITRPNIILVIPFMGVWIFAKIPIKHALRNLILFLIGIVIVIGPVILRQHTAGGEFVFIQKRSAFNLYMGLNPRIDSPYSIVPGVFFQKRLIEPVRLGLVSNNAQNMYWIKKTISTCVSNPYLFIEHIAKNISYIFSTFEISTNKAVLYNKNFSPLIFALPGFWLIGPLGICGMFIGIKYWPRHDLYYIFTAAIFLTATPFPPFARYRLTFVALLIIFAALAIAEFSKSALSGDRGRVRYYALIFILSALAINLDMGNVRLKEKPMPNLGLAGAFIERSDFLTALKQVKLYLYSRPNDPEGYKQLGDIYMAMKDLPRAQAAYCKALKLEPEYYEVINNIGVVKAMMGDMDSSKKYFKMALVINPTLEGAKKNLRRCERIEDGQRHYF